MRKYSTFTVYCGAGIAGSGTVDELGNARINLNVVPLDGKLYFTLPETK